MSGQWGFMDQMQQNVGPYAAIQEQNIQNTFNALAQQAYVDAAFQQHLAKVRTELEAVNAALTVEIPSLGSKMIAALQAEVARLQAELALAKPMPAPLPDPSAMPARAINARFRGGLISSPGDVNGH